ncbi:MAG TPA: hypothetical protein VN436_16635 [Holophaga sp.]|nr:hypothetical protein [Holophaga sp.]
MGMTYRQGPDVDSVLIVCEGPTTAGVLVESMARWSKDGLFDDHPYILVDARNMEVAFTGEELRAGIQAVLRPIVFRHRLRIGIVVETLVQFGSARQFQVFFSGFGDIGVFQDPASACRWVNSFKVPALC